VSARAPALWACLLAAPGLPACGASDAPRDTLLVFASASLTECTRALADAFERRRPGTDVHVHVAGTPRLLVQLREGADADVLATADPTSARRAVELGRAVGEPRTLATNRLAIAVAAGNPHRIGGLDDLLREDLRVALCGPEVPAGRYAREALAAAGVRARSLSDEPSVRALLAKLRLGELDAGIVYATDVRAGPGVQGVALALHHDLVTTCAIVPLAGGASPAAGRAFVEFAISPEGRRLVRASGLGVP